MIPRGAIPVLMYHKVGSEFTVPGDRFLNVGPETFKAQMELLKRLGFTAVTFDQVVGAVIAKTPLPPKSFCATFDDAYSCVYEYAFPVLANLGWPATFFVVSDYVGKDNGWDRPLGLPMLPLLGWDELKIISEAGWEMAGHTHTHVHLDELDDAISVKEIGTNKQQIEQQIGIAPSTFCYPYGHFNARTPGLLAQLDYTGACTTESGLAKVGDDPMKLPRIKIGYRDGTAGLIYRMVIRPKLPNMRRKRRDMVHQ